MSWPCELGADQGDGVLLVVLVAVVEVLQSCSSCSSSPCRMCSAASSQFLDRVLDIPVGCLVGDAQCKLCTGPWSSTGPVLWYGVQRPLLCNNRCRGRLYSRMLGSTVDTCSASLLGAFWKNFTNVLREGSTQILMSILRPALQQ